MAKVNPHKQPVLKVGGKRNSFPLGHSTVFQSPFGALLPVQFFRVPANSYFTMDMENQTIMSPVVRPAFSLMREHFEVFAVPMVQLMQSFDNFITGLSVYDNSAVSYFNTDQNTDKPVTRVKVPTVSGEIIRMALADLNTKVDDFGINKANNATRILDMLGYGNFYSLANEFGGNPHSTASQDDQAFDNSMLRQNLFALLAYQKIYYSHYVNSKYEEIDPRSFNIDDLSNDLTTSDVERFEKMLELHYRYTKKDYFTDVNPYVLPSSDSLNFHGLRSEVYGTNNLWQVFGLPSASRNSHMPSVELAENLGSTATNTDGQVVYTQMDEVTPITVNDIRFAFAYDKLLRRMRVAGSDFNSQMLAQFGVVPLDQRHGRAKYLGGWTNNLRFSEVTSMADSGSADLGNIGGKMSTFNLNKKRIKYTAKEDSIIMVIYSTSLENQYHSFHQRRENLCQFRFDWYNPAFQDLGPQALYGAEWTNISEQADLEDAGTDPVVLQQNFNSTTEKRAILGFVRRWQDYKTRYNEVHGLFQWPYLNADMSSWVAQHRDYKIKNTYPKNASVGSVKDELLPYIPFTRSNLRNSPLALNDVLQVSYNGYWNTDPFMCFCYFNARMVANMSDYGEIL